MPSHIVNKFRIQNRPHFGHTPEPLTPMEVAEALRYIPTRPNRAEWLKIASAVFAAIGEHEGCIALNAWSPEETPGEYAALYRHRLQKVGAGTLVHLAKLKGWRRERTPHAKNRQRNAFAPMTLARPRPQRKEHQKARETLPPLTKPSVHWLNAARLHRQLGPLWAGLDIAVRRHLLFVGAWRGRPAVILTDGMRRSCMIRRADFHEWETHNGNRKSDTPIGWGMSWPVGAHALAGDMKDASLVILTEGFWDCLAAFIAAFDYYGSEAAMRHVCIIAMPTGSPSIAADALPLFSGRHVRIIYHFGDKDRTGAPDLYDAKGEGTGYRAALKWRDQLEAAGATVDAFPLADLRELHGKGDLNDAVSAAFDATPSSKTPALFASFFSNLPSPP